LLGDFAMPCGARELIDGLVVPLDAEPFEAFEDGLIAASVERSRSVSSIRSSILPPCLRA
jgi:hypothetical protein